VKAEKLIFISIFFILFAASRGNTFDAGSKIKLKLFEKGNTFLYEIDRESEFGVLNRNGRIVPSGHFKVPSKYFPETTFRLKESKNKFHPVRFGVVAGGMALAWIGMNVYYNQTWWSTRVHYFKYGEDPYYSRQVDKWSHAYTSNLIAQFSDDLYGWCGLPPVTSMIVGSTIAVAYETYIESNDGISPIWGWDWGDMAGNFIGSLYHVAQRLVPRLEAINIKWSFKPKWLIRGVNNNFALLDDYTSMTFWLAINPHDLLPAKIAKYYPAFLDVAVGLSMRGASALGNSTNAYRAWLIGLDIDITKLPGNTPFLKKLKKILNYYHIPMPAIQILPTGIWYGLYF